MYASIFTASVEDASEAKAEKSQIAEQLIISERLKKQFQLEIKPIIFIHHHHKRDFLPAQSPQNTQNLVSRKLDITVTLNTTEKKNREGDRRVKKHHLIVQNSN